MDRADLGRITEAVRSLGLEYRHAAGVDMLVDANAPKARSGVRLLFVREKVRPNDLEPVPGMKLISFRQRDKAHIIDMDSVGLITPEIEAGLSEPLRDRLQSVRAEERGG